MTALSIIPALAPLVMSHDALRNVGIYVMGTSFLFGVEILLWVSAKKSTAKWTDNADK